MASLAAPENRRSSECNINGPSTDVVLQASVVEFRGLDRLAADLHEGDQVRLSDPPSLAGLHSPEFPGGQPLIDGAATHLEPGSDFFGSI